MMLLIFTVILGIGFALFATQNTIKVPVELGNIQYTGIPLYAVALGSLLLGLGVSAILRMIDWATTGLTLRGKDNQIRKSESTVEQLQQKIKELEIENARFKNKTPTNNSTFQRHPDLAVHNPSLIDHIKTSFSH